MVTAMQTSIKVPTIYFWEDTTRFQQEDIPIRMSAAFRWEGMIFGQASDVSKSKKRRRADKIRIINIVKETLDVLIHHGKEVLDRNGDIDGRKVIDLEAKRHYLDPLWSKRIKALNQVMLIKEISQEEARRLKFKDYNN